VVFFPLPFADCGVVQRQPPISLTLRDYLQYESALPFPSVCHGALLQFLQLSHLFILLFGFPPPLLLLSVIMFSPLLFFSNCAPLSWPLFLAPLDPSLCNFSFSSLRVGVRPRPKIAKGVLFVFFLFFPLTIPPSNKSQTSSFDLEFAPIMVI